MKRMFICVLILLALSACSYWWPIGDPADDNATYMPPNLPPQPTLIYPELPWNHPCNDPAVPQLPGACP